MIFVWLIFFGLSFVLRTNSFDFRRWWKSRAPNLEAWIYFLDELLLEVEMGRAIDEKIFQYFVRLHEELQPDSPLYRSFAIKKPIQNVGSAEKLKAVLRISSLYHYLWSIAQARFHRRERLIELRQISHLAWRRQKLLHAFLFQARFQSVFMGILWLVVCIGSILSAGFETSAYFHLLSFSLMCLGTFIQIGLARIPRWKT